MYNITKSAANFIRENLPCARISKTMKGHTSRRGKYYVEETSNVLKLLDEYKRTEKIIKQYLN